MSASRARWAVALRVARRSAVKSWGRSLLVMALIAVPVAGLSAGVVVFQSTQATPAETVTNALGHAQARISVVDGPNVHINQDPTNDNQFGSTGNADDRGTPADPRTLLPAGTRILKLGTTAMTVSTAAGVASLNTVVGPSWDASLDGVYRLSAGRAPRNVDEVAASPAALSRIGVKLGGAVQVLQPVKRTVRIVGIEVNRSSPANQQTIFGTSAIVPATSVATGGVIYYLPDHAMNWAAVQRLNAHGMTVLSRAVVLDPPATSPDEGSSGAAYSVLIVVGMGVTFAVLEVGLLAGAAFAVGARLQQRMLATIASVGGERSILTRMVTASGVVLGFAGALAGLVLGTVGAAIFEQLTTDGSATRYPGFHVPIAYFAGILVFGVAVGWLSAIIPARAASKIDVVRALRGARTPTKTGVKRPVLGLVLVIAGIVASMTGGTVLFGLLGHDNGDNSIAISLTIALLAGGAVVAQIGALLCTGLILRTVSRGLSRSALGTRLGARDTSRNLGRTVPAVAAIMTTVFVAVFAMCMANSLSLSAVQNHYWTANLNQATSAISNGTDTAPTEHLAGQWVATMRQHLPITSLAVLRTPDTSATAAKKPSNDPKDALPQLFADYGSRICSDKQRQDLTSPTCGRFSSAYAGSSLEVTIGSTADLAVLLGHPVSKEAARSLVSGGAVVLHTDALTHGTVRMDWMTPKQLTDPNGSSKPQRITYTPAVVDLPTVPLDRVIFLGTVGAQRLGIHPVPSSVVASLRHLPSDAQQDAVNSALGALANQPDSTGMVTVESGPQDFGGPTAWIVLLVCLLIAVSAGATAIGLARVDGRADDATFASLGAPPRIRRSIAFTQGLIICGTGGVIGAALGLLPAAALGIASATLAFSPPWIQVALTVVGIPLVIACGSWLLVSNRQQLGRRLQVG